MKATSFRLPDSTVEQLRHLMERLDMTRTQVLIVALDRLHGEMFGRPERGPGKPEAGTKKGR